MAGLNGLGFSVWISRGAGLCLGVDGLLLILPGASLSTQCDLYILISCGVVLRNTVRFLRPSLTWLMPLDENIWFHRQIASSLLFWTIVHTTAHCESPHSPLDQGLTRFLRRQHDPCRADAGQEGDGHWDHVHSAWSLHGTRHAPHHVLDVSTSLATI